MFTIRPEPLEKESLSSYLIRLSDLNEVSMSNLLITIRECRYKLSCDNLSKVDQIPRSILFREKLSGLTNFTFGQLQDMTFQPIYDFFLDSYNLDNYGCFMSKELVLKHRRFCPKCLSQSNSYKLIWQIKEIQLCYIHQCMLQSICSRCKKEQPYYHDSLKDCRCKYCKFPLSVGYGTATLANLSNTNEISTWEYLLNLGKFSLKRKEGFSKKQTLAMLLLYLDKDKQLIDRYSFYRLRKIVRNNQEETNSFITLNFIKGILKKHQICFEDFMNIEVPDSYLSSLFESPKPKVNGYKIGSCNTPWCQYKGENSHIREIPFNLMKQEVYEKIMMCLGCSMKYGLSVQSGRWEHVKDRGYSYFELIQEVLNCLTEFKSKYKLAEHIGISNRLLYEIIGYILSRKLAPNDYLEKYSPRSTPNNLVECFRMICEQTKAPTKKEYQKTAKRIYGWGIMFFYYFYAKPEVQVYLNIEKRLERKREKEDEIKSVVTKLVQSEISISRESIAAASNLNHRELTLHRSLADRIKESRKNQISYSEKNLEAELFERVNSLLNAKDQHCELVTSKETYKYLGIKPEKVKVRYPRLSGWISSRLKINKQIYKQKELDIIKKDIKELFLTYHEIGRMPTRIDISNYLGIKSTNLDPKIAQYINEEREKLKGSRV